MDEIKIIRLTGIAGITGTLLMFTGDMFLYGGYINLIFLLFFCVSTFSLWHGRRRLED